MFKKLFSLALASLLLNLMCAAPVTARRSQDTDAKRVAQVKAAVAKLGTGPKARLEVRLRDKAKLKGYVSETREDRFLIADTKTGALTEVIYSDVEKVTPGIKKGFSVTRVLLVTALSVGVVLGLSFLLCRIRCD
jgi:ABC-type dipeptide/oligopeptide/nickel transport system permease component